MAKVDPNAFVTNKTLQEAVDTILERMDGLIKEFRIEVKSSFNKVGLRLDNLEDNISNRVSLGQFSQLKTKVDKHLVN